MFHLDSYALTIKLLPMKTHDVVSASKRCLSSSCNSFFTYYRCWNDIVCLLGPRKLFLQVFWFVRSTLYSHQELICYWKGKEVICYWRGIFIMESLNYFVFLSWSIIDLSVPAISLRKVFDAVEKFGQWRK